MFHVAAGLQLQTAEFLHEVFKAEALIDLDLVGRQRVRTL
jgi:hypothetical protein